MAASRLRAQLSRVGDRGTGSAAPLRTQAASASSVRPQWDIRVFEWAHLYVWQALIMLDVMIVWLLWVRTLPRSQPAFAA